MPRQKIQIEAAALEECARAGFSEEEIAIHLGLSRTTLNLRRKESDQLEQAIKRGRLASHAKVSDYLAQQCKAGNVAAIIWYEKTRRGMSDRQDITSNGKELSRHYEVTVIDERDSEEDSGQDE